MNSGKTVMQEFVEANQGLLNCYNSTLPEEFRKLNEAQRESLCFSHKEKIKEILRGNQLVMSNLIKERVEILKRLGAETKIEIRE